MNLTTGYPYFLINSGLPATYPKLGQSVKAEVVIIGGGISGALSAYYLVNAGLDCIGLWWKRNNLQRHRSRNNNGYDNRETE
jgi:hypothetical protein